MKIRKRIKEGKESTPQVKYVVIWLFAGHGILKDGYQHLVFNEYDKISSWYKMLNFETQIRLIAAQYENSYMITIFACCRQNHKEADMSGCVSRDEANKLEEEANDLNDLSTDFEGKVTVRKGRGLGASKASAIKASNFLFVWGCRPSDQVGAETVMVRDIVKMLTKNFDHDTLTVQLPDSFEQLKGEDANFEMVTSNTI